MQQSQLLSKHLHEVFYGGNWTSVNLKSILTGVTHEQALTKAGSLNTVAALVYHINYYVQAILNVLKGGPLDAHDKYSFDLPVITCETDWQNMLEKMWRDADELIALISRFPASELDSNFTDQKYGSYARNFLGLIEHTHYHMGQIVVILKMNSTSG